MIIRDGTCIKYRAVMQAIEAGDGARAAQLMREHFANGLAAASPAPAAAPATPA